MAKPPRLYAPPLLGPRNCIRTTGDARPCNPCGATPPTLHVLGGEIIDLNETPWMRKVPVEKFLADLVEDGGPLLYHSDSEEQQRSFESTCRKFRRFLTAFSRRPAAGTHRFRRQGYFPNCTSLRPGSVRNASSTLSSTRTSPMPIEARFSLLV